MRPQKQRVDSIRPILMLGPPCIGICSGFNDALWAIGYGFWWALMKDKRFPERPFVVQGNLFILCSSTTFVRYSHHPNKLWPFSTSKTLESSDGVNGQEAGDRLREGTSRFIGRGHYRLGCFMSKTRKFISCFFS